ncbi:MAG: zinc transporter ZntB [Hyphomonadaceae bacterium]
MPDEPEAIDAGLVFGCVMDGRGGCRRIGWAEATGWKPDAPGETLWLHLDRTVGSVRDWLEREMTPSEATLDLLVSNETRPRAYRDEEALITVLRGINLNPGAEPEDMIAMQMLADSRRVITLRRRRLQTPRDVLADLEAGRGPCTAGDLVTGMIARLVGHMNESILEMNEQIDRMEEQARETDPERLLTDIAEIRRNCLALKRHMSPQHEALGEIQRSAPDWMSEDNREEIRETIDRLRRYLDDLDVSKESAIVLQDDLNNRAATRMNRTMYSLSIVAAIFLPLSFVTGLLGINVGGMPGVDSGNAFWITVGLLVILLGLQFWIFRKLRWL